MKSVLIITLSGILCVYSILGLNKNSFAQPLTGKCGDGVCDEFERASSNLCPQDCAPEKSTESSGGQKSAAAPIGKCGDTICDEFEKANPGVCPADCGGENTEVVKSKRLYQCPQYTPPDPSFYENCRQQGGTVTPGGKDEKGCQSPPRCVLSVTANVTVDYSKELGRFSPYLFGINTRWGCGEAAANGFKFCTSGGVPPMANPKDANDQSNYSFFLEMDEEIATTFKAGMEPQIIFGALSPNQDIEQLSIYVKKVATHLRDTKWPNNGKIKIIRCGNEPDNAAFWPGTQEDFFKSYAAFAKSVKAVDADFILDAPGLMISEIEDSRSWIKPFLSYMNKNKASVDIFDVHLYSSNPYAFYNQFKSIMDEVAQYPNLSIVYGTPKLANNEWNFMLGDEWSGGYHKQFDTVWLASHNIAALINMIEQGVVLSIPLNEIRPGKHDYGLVDSKGNGKPAYYAFKGFNQLADTNRLSSTGTDHANLSAMAGMKDNQITIVISNYDTRTYMDKYEDKFLDKKSPAPGAPSRSWSEYNAGVSKYGEPKVYNKYTLTLNNLPWSSSDKVTYERYIVDDNKKLELAETKTMPGGNTLTFTKDISAPSVEVVKVYVK